jgi:hypothetical protein
MTETVTVPNRWKYQHIDKEKKKAFLTLQMKLKRTRISGLTITEEVPPHKVSNGKTQHHNEGDYIPLRSNASCRTR